MSKVSTSFSYLFHYFSRPCPKKGRKFMIYLYGQCINFFQRTFLLLHFPKLQDKKKAGNFNTATYISSMYTIRKKNGKM